MVVAAGVVVVAKVVDRGGGDQGLLEATLDCSSHIDIVADLPSGFRVVLRGVAINSMIVHQQGRRGTDLSPESPLRFSKIPLLVRPNHEFQITLGDDFLESVRLDWSGTNSLAQRVAIGPCAGDSDDWLVFAGGVWVAEPRCVEIVFSSSNRRNPVELSIAEPCPSAA